MPIKSKWRNILWTLLSVYTGYLSFLRYNLLLPRWCQGGWCKNRNHWGWYLLGIGAHHKHDFKLASLVALNKTCRHWVSFRWWFLSNTISLRHTLLFWFRYLPIARYLYAIVFLIHNIRAFTGELESNLDFVSPQFLCKQIDLITTFIRRRPTTTYGSWPSLFLNF